MVRIEKNRYTESMKRPDKAEGYATKYEREVHKVLSDRREKRVLRSILERAGRHRRFLDVPCGAGRLSVVFADYAERLYGADTSRAILGVCRRLAAGSPALAAASAFQLPFGDGTFDMVASIRLSHHIPDRQGRIDHFREILRVSSRHALLTFFASDSVKSRLRGLYRRLGGRKRDKYMLSLGEVERIAAERGFRIVVATRLSRLFSGHVFVLLERSAPAAPAEAGS